jgi:hypothetical protein
MSKLLWFRTQETIDKKLVLSFIAKGKTQACFFF